MNQINNFLTCKYDDCNKYYLLPIKLPCDKSICKEHIDKLKSENLESFNCQFCNTEHEIPHDGFKLNHDIMNVLEMNLHLSPSQKKLNEAITNLSKLVKNMKSLARDSYLHDYLSLVRKEVKMQRDNLKVQINEISNFLLKEIDEFESECKRDKSTVNKSLHLIKKDAKRLNIDMLNYAKEIRDPNLEEDLSNILIEKIDSEININEKNIVNIRNELLKNKNIFFEKSKQNLEKNLFGEIIINSIEQNESDKIVGENLENHHENEQKQIINNKSNSPRLITSPHASNTRPMLINNYDFEIDKQSPNSTIHDAIIDQTQDTFENELFLICEILYYIREGFQHSAIKLIHNKVKQYPDSVILKYYNAIALALEGKNNEAIELFKTIRKRNDVGLGAKIALFFIYKKIKQIDQENINKLNSMLEDEYCKANEKSLYYCAYSYYAFEDYLKAVNLADRGIKINCQYAEILSLRGWIQIRVDFTRAFKYFRTSSNLNIKFYDSLLGEAKVYELDNKFSPAIERLNKAIEHNSDSVCLFIEKMKLELYVQNWIQCYDFSIRALSLDNNCLEAIRYQILEILCRYGRYEQVAEELDNLYDALIANEPNNHYLFYEYAKVFARLCSSDSRVLNKTKKFIEKALSLNHINLDYINEYASHNYRLGNYSEAFKYYTRALKFDKNNINAILGKLKCDIILNEDTSNISSQFESLMNNFKNLEESTPEFGYIRSLYYKKIKLDRQNAEIITKAVLNHSKQVKGLPLGLEYFYKLNPDFVLDLIKEYMQLFSNDGKFENNSNKKINLIFRKTKLILETLVKIVPGLIKGVYYLAKTYFVLGETDKAILTAQSILDKYQNSHILMAEIYLDKNDLKSSNESLKFGFSCNQEIENNPLYHLYKSIIFKKENNYNDALDAAKLALKNLNKNSNEILIQDVSKIYLELAENYYLNELLEDSKNTIIEAENIFHGTIEQNKITKSEIRTKIFKNDN